MTVTNETGNVQVYSRLRFIEFMELICRIAKYKCIDQAAEHHSA